jgi:DNA-binding winged helix-turn-helix (wHTH) protein
MDIAHRYWRRTVRLANRLARVEGRTGPSRPARRFGYWSPLFGPPTSPALVRRLAPTRDRLMLTGPGGAHTQSRHQVDQVSRTGFIPLVVDRVRSVVMIGGQRLHLEGCDLLLELLTALIRGGGGPLSIHELYERVWSHRAVHRSQLKRVHYHVCRFRRMLDEMGLKREILVTCPNGYRLAPGMQYILVEADGTERPVSPKSTPSATTGVERVLAQRGFVDNRTYRQLRSISRSLAARELRRLVDQGVLIQDGLGRAARYRLAGPASQAA